MTSQIQNSSKSLGLSQHSQNVEQMFDKIAPQYDFLNGLLSFKQDVRWRNHMVNLFPKITSKNGILLDVACGTGDVGFSVLSRRCDYSQVCGFDISAGMLAQGQHRVVNWSKAHPQNKGQISFSLGSAENLPVGSSFCDALSISFGFRNVDDRKKALSEFHRVLKPGASLFILDFFECDSGFFAYLFRFYFNQILPFIGGIFSDKKAYKYLPNSVKTMPSGDVFKSMLVDAGFAKVTQIKYLFGAVRLWIGTKL